jgi:LemA protein
MPVAAAATASVSPVLAAIAVVVAVLGLIAFVWLTYNRMVAKRQATENSWSQIDVALRRRHDLIPTLVESVKGYAAHERTTFENVTEARSGAIAARGPAQRAVAESELGRETKQLLVVAEAYPELEASTNFSKLQDDLRETEDQIAITRRVYNDTVETYNTLIQVFPAVIVAKIFGFDRREFFDAPSEVETAPEVSLSPGPA